MEETGNQIAYQPQPSLPMAIFILIQIIFVILLIISVPKLFESNEINSLNTERNPSASITNLSSLVPEDYPMDGVGDIEVTLFDLARRNSSNSDIPVSIKATIREDSVKNIYFKDQNLNYFSAIIDIPELEQSYWFYNEFSNNKKNEYITVSKIYRIFCLDDPEDIIYPNFKCEDDFGTAGRLEVVSDFINYFNFNYFSPSYSSLSQSNEIKIYPFNFNQDNTTKESYIQQTKNAIDSLGISPDLFEYRVMSAEDINYTYP